MSQFEAKKFNIPKLKGMSEKNIEEHLKLYSGYVNNSNLVLQKIEEYKKDAEKNAYVLGELARRFSFEYNGMRNHEVFFSSLEGDNKQPLSDGPLKKMISEIWGSFDSWLAEFKSIGLTRGIGWAVLWYDPKNKRLLNTWVEEHHIGQLNGSNMILAMDVWEHAFVYDYQPSGKKQFIEDFLTANVNWKTVAENFDKPVK